MAYLELWRHNIPADKELIFSFVYFFPERIPYNMDLTKLRRQRQRERQKSNRFNKQNNNSASASRFSYISLQSRLHNYDVKWPNFKFILEREPPCRKLCWVAPGFFLLEKEFRYNHNSRPELYTEILRLSVLRGQDAPWYFVCLKGFAYALKIRDLTQRTTLICNHEKFNSL